MLSESDIEGILERYIKQESIVSLGTGQTNEDFLKKIALYMERSGLKIQMVATSHHMAMLCSQFKIPLASVEDVEIDVAFDFVDQVDEDFNYVSNETTSLVRDKMISMDAAEMIVISEEKNFVKTINAPICVEATTFAIKKTIAHLMNLGEPKLRVKDNKPILSETGNYFVDLKFDQIYSLEDLDFEARKIPGVLETSLFLGYADRAILYGENLIVKSRLTNTD